MTKVLLIDDDVVLAEMLREYLGQEGFAVDVRHDGADGALAACADDYAIVVLDVMMPRLDGIEALKLIRARSNVPVLMLTARGDDADRIAGLEFGADDYVPKPCSPREILARLRAILRRTEASLQRTAVGGVQPEPAAPLVLTVGALVMWPEQRRATWDGATLELTGSEYSLLEVLARHAGRTVSKNELSEQGLGRPLARYDRSIDVHLSSIRHKLGVLGDGRSCIQTVYRLGYQLLRA